MTPKEKAEELYIRFLFSSIYFTNGYDGAKLNAKTCALLAVDEIKTVLDGNESHWNFQTVKYWQEVKSELEKL